jgi:hypothetical protein
MSQNLSAKYAALAAKIDDAYENKFLTGNGKDQICNVMCALYPTESKAIALETGEMDADDDFTPTVPIDDLFASVEDSGQFIDELDAVIDHACKARMKTSELIEFMLSFR